MSYCPASRIAAPPENSRWKRRNAGFVFLGLSAIINRCVFYPLKSRKCEVMALKCAICGKAPHFGNVVSHANNTRRRRWNPNLKRVRAVVDGVRKQVRVCTGCIRLGRVKKAA
jgi:large subunit ribosomal protein L28